MQITEIYKSIQGESTYAGLPCVFVRLTGCNLRCSWCDSEYTFTGGPPVLPHGGKGGVRALTPGELVEISGGATIVQGRGGGAPIEEIFFLRFTLLPRNQGQWAPPRG